jgi:hypothetical protein
MSFLVEFWRFLRVRKKYWLFPVLFMMVVFSDRADAGQRRGAVYLHIVLSSPMRILGVSALYHDSAAALVVDGHVIAAAARSTIQDFPATLSNTASSRGNARSTNLTSLSSTTSHLSNLSDLSKPTWPLRRGASNRSRWPFRSGFGKSYSRRAG